MIEFNNSNIFISDSYQDIPTNISSDTLIFLDFEFNNFKEKRPISIGICSIDSSQTFYAEFEHPDNYFNENEWVMENVIAHLENKQENIESIKNKITQFLKKFDNKKVFLLSDNEIDIEIFKSLNLKLENPITLTRIEDYVLSFIESIAPARENIDKHLNCIQDILSPLDKYEEYFQKNKIIQHHSLNDVKALATIMQESLKKYKEKYNE